MGETRFESVCEAGSGGESGGAERGVGGDLRVFPELRSGSVKASATGAVARKRKRHGMTAAQAEVSKRMRKRLGGRRRAAK